MPFQRTGNLRPSPQIDLFLTTVPTNRAMTLSTTKAYQLSSPIAQTHPSKPVNKVSPPLPSDHLSSWFPNSTEIIFLNHNLLTKLTNSTFYHLIHLKHLDLSDNDISEIHLLAFDGLTSLRFLRLNYNYIAFNAVSPYIFKQLNNLQSLDLIQRPRAEKVDVPGLMLQPLTQLRRLALGTFSSTLYFGPEFLNLTHLEVLEITGSTQYITQASFKNVNGLKELVISGMSLLKSMDDKVFVHFKNLTVLKMFYTVIDLQRVLSLLWPFTGREMSEILFRGITATLEMPDPMRNGYLTKKDLITTWDRCLRNILISGNPIIGSAIALFPLALLQNLTTAVVGNAMRTCQSFSPFPRFSLTKDNYLRNSYYNELPFHDSFFGLENLAVSKCQLDRIFFAIKSDRVFENTTKLKELDLSENSLNALSKGTFARNSELVYLSLSGNQFKDIPFDLKSTPNLKNLDLSIYPFDPNAIPEDMYLSFFTPDRSFPDNCVNKPGGDSVNHQSISVELFNCSDPPIQMSPPLPSDHLVRQHHGQQQKGRRCRQQFTLYLR
uniref:Uncharacterized protein n=1 Tax=Biomphalaria glabrata TaxID=6526 RepID=A0A2C9LWT3_BIOGL